MISPINNFNLQNNKFEFSEGAKYKEKIFDSFYDLSRNSFFFNEQRNSKIEKHVIKKLGERKNLWEK